jgi:hypothetical protein
MGLNLMGIVTEITGRGSAGRIEYEEQPWRKIASSATKKTSSACT